MIEFRIFDKTITVETAKGKRSCKTIGCSNGHTIYPGEQHLAIYNADGIRNNYCSSCAKDKMKELENQVCDAVAVMDDALQFVEKELNL